MKLTTILALGVCLLLWTMAVGQPFAFAQDRPSDKPKAVNNVERQLTVQVPPGEYEFWLEWREEGKEKEGKHTKATGAECKVDLAEFPAGAKEQRLLVLNPKTGLLAERQAPAEALLPLKEQDFHLLPQLSVTVRVPGEEQGLLAEVVLEQPEARRSAQVEISGREGKAIFDRIDAFLSTRVRVTAPGYRDYEMPVSLLDADKRGVPVIEIGLTRVGPPAPAKPAALPSGRTAWSLFFLIAVAVTGLASLILAGISLAAGDPVAAPPSRQWLLSLWAPPLLGMVGWWVGAMLVAIAGGQTERWTLFLPVVGWAYLLASLAIARTGRLFLCASALVATSASAGVGLAFLSPAGSGLFWVTFVFAALTLVSSLVGGLAVALTRPVVAPVPGGEVREAGVCPYCGERRDPLTGACGCEPRASQRGEPSRPRAVGAARLVVEGGEKAGQSFSLGEQFTIGREADNDLVLADMTVSRRHCVIVREGSERLLRDEGSANGTFVNGERVRERRLSSGDRIQVGSAAMRFEE